MKHRPICAIAVMAKAPRPGFSKTRLCPPLDHVQAATLSAAFLRDITENIALAASEASIACYIAYAPAGQEALFDGHLAPGTGLLLADGTPSMPQAVQGFGRCLLHAIQSILALGHTSAVVVNSDSPTLPNALLVQTAAALAAEGDRIVLGPADDGGYYLLGMKAAHAHLFADIAWSTDTVAETTRLRARQLGLEVIELPIWYDVDDKASLNRLLRETAAPPTSPPPTSSPPSPKSSPRTSWPGLARPPTTSLDPASQKPVPPPNPNHDAAPPPTPYPAPFTARVLTRMGLRAPNQVLAAE